MNNYKIKRTMEIIVVITILISTAVMLCSLILRLDPVYYSSPKDYEILYQGEVTEITYWNITVEHINLRYLNYSIRDYTYRLCNFTILNGTSNKEIKLTTYAYYFIEYEVEIGDTVIIHHSYGTIWDFKVIKKENV